MNFSNVSKKLTNPDGSLILESVYQIMRNKRNVRILDYLEITDNTAMKIDKIAEHYYGTMDDAWIIMKFNGIGNFAAVPVGKVIFIPEKESFFTELKVIQIPEQRRTTLGQQNRPSATNPSVTRSTFQDRTSSFKNNNGTLSI